MKTNSKEVKVKIQSYIIDCIDLSDYDNVKQDTDKDKLQFIVSEFHRVAIYPYNLHHFANNYQKMFTDWTMGLPGYFNIEYRNYRILELMAEFGLPLPANKTEEQGIELFFVLVYREFNALLSKHNLSIYNN
jgi:ketopantoate reductase